MEFEPGKAPHCRLNPLTGDWILASVHCEKCPWREQLEKPPVIKSAEYDPQCYFYQENVRANRNANLDYLTTFTFEINFSTLQQEVLGKNSEIHPLLLTKLVNGICRVICY